MYGRSKRTHLLFGAAYLLIGCYCVAMGLGYSFNIAEWVAEPRSQPTISGGVEVVPAAPSAGEAH